MKQLTINIMLLFLSYSSQAQNLAIEPVYNNFLYTGIKNLLNIAVENCSNDSISFEVSNGKLTREENNYYLYTDSAGGCRITVYKKAGNKSQLIGSQFFRIKNIPNPVFRIGPKRDEDSISIAELKHQDFVRAELEFFDPTCPVYVVDSFTLYIYQDNDSKPIKIINRTSKISIEMKNAFAKLNKNDQVIFKNIYARAVSDCKNIMVNTGKSFKISPATLYVKF